MNRQQIILALSGLVIVIGLFLFGNTIPPKKEMSKMPAAEGAKPNIQFSDLLLKAKQRLTPAQAQRVLSMENSVSRGDVKEQKLHAFQQLASFWKDSVHLFEPYAYYNGEAAKLESSEKNLTFAAQQFVDRLLVEGNPAMGNWLATSAKVLLEQALLINPNNDSSKIGLGACYILGNISDNPMQGILPVRAITEKNPKNLYAQYVLALGGKKSGQYDKAIDRFKLIADAEPKNIEMKLHLAECYDMKGDKENAIKWYTLVKEKVKNENAIKELTDRINLLKQ